VCDLISQRLQEQSVVMLAQDSFYRNLTPEELVNVKGGSCPALCRGCGCGLGAAWCGAAWQGRAGRGMIVLALAGVPWCGAGLAWHAVPAQPPRRAGRPSQPG
jgi:hypothetical protein